MGNLNLSFLCVSVYLPFLKHIQEQLRSSLILPATRGEIKAASTSNSLSLSALGSSPALSAPQSKSAEGKGSERTSSVQPLASSDFPSTPLAGSGRAQPRSIRRNVISGQTLEHISQITTSAHQESDKTSEGERKHSEGSRYRTPLKPQLKMIASEFEAAAQTREEDLAALSRSNTEQPRQGDQ